MHNIYWCLQQIELFTIWVTNGPLYEVTWFFQNTFLPVLYNSGEQNFPKSQQFALNCNHQIICSMYVPTFDQMNLSESNKCLKRKLYGSLMLPLKNKLVVLLMCQLFSFHHLKFCAHSSMGPRNKLLIQIIAM